MCDTEQLTCHALYITSFCKGVNCDLIVAAGITGREVTVTDLF